MKIIESYKELKTHPRLHGLIRLGLWLIPFIIIVIIIRNTPGSSFSNVEEDTYMSNLEKLEVFKFTYSNDDILYEGKYLKGQIILLNDNNNFMIKDNIIYYEKMDHELEDIYYIYPKNLYEFINNNEIYATTNYKDESVSYCYMDENNNMITIKVKDNKIINALIEYNDIKYNIDYYDYNNEDFIIDESIYTNVLNDENDENPEEDNNVDEENGGEEND